MERKLKHLYLADLTAFGLTIFASTINHTPLLVAGSVAGLGLSSYLVSVVPDKKTRELETQTQFLEMQSQLENVKAERDWLESLSASQSQKLISAHNQEIDGLQTQLEATERKLAMERRLKKEGIEKAREGKKKALANQADKYQREIVQLTAQADKRIGELEREVVYLKDVLKVLEEDTAFKVAEVEARASQLKKIEEALQKQSAEISLSEKALRLEEKRIGLDVRDERGQTKQHLEKAQLEIEALNALAAKMQAELTTVRQTNRELWAAQYDRETDNTTAKVQAVLASAGCPTELLSSDSAGCKLRPLSLDGWDKKGIEKVAEQIPAFANLTKPPKMRFQNSCIELIYDYQESVKPSASKALKFYDWSDAKDEASGFVVCGNTGAGKTAVVAWLLGLLTEDSPKQIIVLDIHAQKNHWHDYGLAPIFKQDEVLAALQAILAELKRRKEAPGNYEPLIVVFDEVAATRINALEKEEKQFINDALLLLGAEGRKFDIILIAMNQSKNTAALGIDAQNRNNYFLVLLCAAARDWAEYEWGKDNEKTRHIFDTPYSCVVSGCVSDQIAAHPTHGEYTRFKKKGLAPKNMKPINALAPVIVGLPKQTIRLVTADNSEPLPAKDYPLLSGADNCADNGCGERIIASDKLAQIKRFWAEGEKRLTVIIPAIWGCEVGTRAYNKARKEYAKLIGE